MKRSNPYMFVLKVFLLIILQFALEMPAFGQKNYTIREGKMFVNLGKSLPESELDDFIAQFDLKHLALKRFIKNGYTDSIRLAGWELIMDSPREFVITKPFSSFDDINNPIERLLMIGANMPNNGQFPQVHNVGRFGYNEFRNKMPFAHNDSIVTFYLRQNLTADRVTLAGTFNAWDPTALPMTKTDSGWIARVRLRPGKYLYKFVIDGRWEKDHDNRMNENDGMGNTNSVYYFPNHVFTLRGYEQAKKVIVTGSFNDWNEKELSMQRTAAGWELPVYLANGTHTYRFIVDRKWLTDPENPDRLPNEFGEFNSFVSFGKPHVFRLEGHQNAQYVTVAGSFNRWMQHELIMKKTTGGWELPYVLGAGNYNYRFFVDGHPVGETFSLVLEPNYTFRLKEFPNAKKVYLAGDFNNWDPNALPMKFENGEWVYSVHLSRGKHLYKYIIDGQWVLDPANPLWEENEHHTGNSVLWIDR